jgi:RimJ/RimL family protein N-acetyltransferase
VIGFVFGEYAVERLQAEVFVGNDPSERVLQKLGFKREGVLRSYVLRRGRWWDVVMYSVLSTEFKNLGPK